MWRLVANFELSWRVVAHVVWHNESLAWPRRRDFDRSVTHRRVDVVKAVHTHLHAYGQFIIFTEPNIAVHISGLWKEAEENPMEAGGEHSNWKTLHGTSRLMFLFFFSSSHLNVNRFREKKKLCKKPKENVVHVELMLSHWMKWGWLNFLG